MSKIISGIQQIGVGIPDVDLAWAWYRTYFGMDIHVFREAAEAPLMTQYTGDAVQSRDAALAINLNGGGGLEIWQYTSRTPQPPTFDVQLGDTGLYAARIKCRDLEATYKRFEQERLDLVSPIQKDPSGALHFFVRDPYGLLFQVVTGSAWFSNSGHTCGGPSGCMIGVSSIEEALPLYRDILGHKVIVYDTQGSFSDLSDLPGGSERVRRMLLHRRASEKGTFAQLLGPSTIELVQPLDRKPRAIFEDRFWGDLGFIHLCFDVQGMDALKKECAAYGFGFTIDSADTFEMGEAAGRFSYIEDPDGTLIEFVETHKMPILKKLGWYLDLRKRTNGRPLPKWMLKMLRFSRVKG